MNTVTTINLAGTAFQIEDPGYDALKKYLDDACVSLGDNPDKDEIIADMERAIADKCRAYISMHKNVVSTEEAEKIVAEMGPVNGSASDGGAATGTPRGPKRLYRIVEGEIIAGVATGVAAYFEIDVMLVRILFVLLAVLTGGGIVFGYLLAWIFIPVAETPQQRAQAFGAPFNAQEIVDRVKTEYARLEAKMPEWKSQLKKAHDAHRNAEVRAKYHAWRRAQRVQRHHGPSVVGQLLQLLVIAFVIWFAYHHAPIVHDFLDAAWALFVRVVDAITQAIASQR